MPTAMYVPKWENAIGDGILQLLLVSILWIVMFFYARRWGARPAAFLLTLGVLLPSLAVLTIEILRGLGTYGDVCREVLKNNYSDMFLIVVSFFDLWTFAIFSFAGMIIALVLIPVAAKHCKGADSRRS